MNAVGQDAARALKIFQALGFLPISQRRRAEPRHSCLARQAHDLLRVLVTRGERLIDEDRLPGGKSELRLVEMRPTVEAFEQNPIHHRTESRDAVYDLDLPLVTQFGRILVDPFPAFSDVRAATLKGRNHSQPGDVLRVGGIIEDSRELDDVGRIRPDDSNANGLV